MHLRLMTIDDVGRGKGKADGNEAGSGQVPGDKCPGAMVLGNQINKSKTQSFVKNGEAAAWGRNVSVVKVSGLPSCPTDNGQHNITDKLPRAAVLVC